MLLRFIVLPLSWLGVIVVKDLFRTYLDRSLKPQATHVTYIPSLPLSFWPSFCLSHMTTILLLHPLVSLHCPSTQTFDNKQSKPQKHLHSPIMTTQVCTFQQYFKQNAAQATAPFIVVASDKVSVAERNWCWHRITLQRRQKLESSSDWWLDDEYL